MRRSENFIGKFGPKIILDVLASSAETRAPKYSASAKNQSGEKMKELERFALFPSFFGMAAMPFPSRGVDFFSYHRMVSLVVNVPMFII